MGYPHGCFIHGLNIIVRLLKVVDNLWMAIFSSVQEEYVSVKLPFCNIQIGVYIIFMIISSHTLSEFVIFEVTKNKKKVSKMHMLLTCEIFM